MPDRLCERGRLSEKANAREFLLVPENFNGLMPDNANA